VRKARIWIRERLQEISKEGVGTVVIYGGGDIAEVVYLAIQEVGMKLSGVVDPARAGRPFLGYMILPMSALPQLPFDRIIVTEPIALQDAGNFFQEYGIGEEKLVHMVLAKI